MGRIRLLDLEAFCHVGHLRSERDAGHHLAVDVEVTMDLRGAARDDDLDATLDYAAVARAVRDALGSGEFVLVEAAAGAALEAVRALAPEASEVVVRVRKPLPPIPDVRVGAAEVELRWSRETDR